MSRELFEQGYEAYEANNYESAINLFTQAIELDQNNNLPIDYDYYLWLGHSYSGMPEYEAATIHYLNAINIDNQRYEAFKGFGDLLFEIEDYQKAIRTYNEAFIHAHASDEQAEIKHDLGVTYFALHQFNEAIESYNQALAFNQADERLFDHELYIELIQDLNDAMVALGVNNNFNDAFNELQID